MSAVHRQELDHLLDDLPEENLRALLEVLRGLGKGRRLHHWSSAIGMLSDEAAAEMRAAIKEGCERIDAEGW